MFTYHVGILIGSLRRESINRRLALALQALAPASLSFSELVIDDLPLYNPDLDLAAAAPPAWMRLRQDVQRCAALLFVTPEYNRSVPAALKNALDVGSRPAGQSVWNGKPAGVVSASPGALGGFAASQHLRQSLVSLNMQTLPQPEAYVAHAADQFDAQGALVNAVTRAHLQKLIDAFAEWIAPRA